MILPARWRKTSPRWHPVTVVHYREIVDGALNNKWEVLSLPTPGLTVEVTLDDTTWLYWRELDVNGDIVNAGALPQWMVYEVII